ncbi:flagellin N-terminal helical domain-containing protein [Bacillus paranthracis]|uniref:flagellin N-terminal helical domain-containing protein n=1 Tax=Bacillus paranthracis TaxID=2026186 RepID=UPI0018CFB2FB|nr:flagellin [Bacillus paranthracis]MBG9909629.1 flagellin [Bacillus paranthracis]
MRINTNINSMRTQEYMRQNQAKMSNAMDRLSSGKRINNASDDAAGLAIATRMRARESGLGVAANNTQDGMALIRTADSAMNSVSNILLRMRDIANQSANNTNTKDNQAALQKEFGELQKQIDYIAGNTQFNDKSLLDGSNKSINIQTLDSADQSKQISIDLKSATLDALGIKDLNVGATENTLASATIKAKDAFDDAKKISDDAKTKIDTEGATAGSQAAIAKKYLDTKAALAIDPTDATAQGEFTAANAALNTTANKDAKALVDDYETKLAATTTKEGEYNAAKATSNKDATAAGLVTEYENKKLAVSGDNVADTYVKAKAAFEANKTDLVAKSAFEAAKTALDDPANVASKTRVEEFEKAKAAGTNEKSLVAVAKIDEALKTIADNRATLGATLNRLDFNVNNLKSQSSAMASAASQIEDADMAKEMSEMTKFKILNEAGISMLSQANQTPQMVSKLLQ